MSYRIVIERIDVVKVIKKEWQKVADFGNERDLDYTNKKGGPQYDYVPLETTERRTTKLLEQEADEVDIKAVIRAVNCL